MQEKEKRRGGEGGGRREARVNFIIQGSIGDIRDLT